ncbi:hypothetical protein [Uliginosibacterium aquaticum]|uniref:Uncharacterized protein n=1 Tax=Uliginosibacterium aquaticum TaxID=2731212 RepID=A0ABX2IF54_9RHOO|nr:hypothetical protein [Uliginosibacterium aquaticum]NSL53577.1 hypothetical protein [Uliginosibacterium aquaticum]
MKQTPMFLMLLLATAMSGSPGTGGSRAASADDDRKQPPRHDALDEAEATAAAASLPLRPAA